MLSTIFVDIQSNMCYNNLRMICKLRKGFIMPVYMTKQRKVLLDFFKNHIDEAVSAQQIAECLKNEDISVSAIYRNLAALEQDGKLQRISKADSREVFYRFKAFSACRDCLHLSCKKCGRTFHLNSSQANNIANTLSDAEDFDLDKSDTILYGVCGRCRK